MAAELGELLRSSDLISRGPGDGFLVMLPESGEEEAARSLAERLDEAIGALDQRLEPVFGSASFPKVGSARQLIALAEGDAYAQRELTMAEGG